MSDLQQAIAWFEGRAKNTPMPGARKMFQIALEALLEKAERENPAPLTMEELRQMDGKPVWIVWPDGRIESRWYIVGSVHWIEMFVEWDGALFGGYGEVWLAYRNKPKEAE